jgi:hypothetical protein
VFRSSTCIRHCRPSPGLAAASAIPSSQRKFVWCVGGDAPDAWAHREGHFDDLVEGWLVSGGAKRAVIAVAVDRLEGIARTENTSAGRTENVRTLIRLRSRSAPRSITCSIRSTTVTSADCRNAVSSAVSFTPASPFWMDVEVGSSWGYRHPKALKGSSGRPRPRVLSLPCSDLVPLFLCEPSSRWCVKRASGAALGKKMMAIRLIVLGIALSLASSNAEAQGSVWLFITGNSLATYCRDFLLVRRNAAASDDQQLQRYAACLGYVAGVSDALTVEGIRHFCLPFRSDSGDITEVVAKYLDQHPEELHMSAYTLVVQSLASAYPCTGNPR